jgi:hypothetical protein
VCLSITRAGHETFILSDLPRLVSGVQHCADIMRSISLLAAFIATMSGSPGHAQDAASVPAFEVASVKLN